MGVVAEEDVGAAEAGVDALGDFFRWCRGGNGGFEVAPVAPVGDCSPPEFSSMLVSCLVAAAFKN